MERRREEEEEKRMKRARRWGAADPNGASVLRYGIAVFWLPPRPLHLEDRTKGESRDILLSCC